MDGSGAVTVDVSVDATKINLGTNNRFLRIGTVMELPAGYENVEWYGNGPVEAMWDREDFARVGKYNTTVSKLFYPYLDTQDTGTLTGVKWFTVTDPNKQGALAIAATDTVEASALHFTAEDLDQAQHPYELTKLDETILTVNYRSQGTGNASCGQDTLSNYLLPNNKAYSYQYTIIPYLTQDEAGAKTDLTELTRPYRTVAVMDENAILEAKAKGLAERIGNYVVMDSDKTKLNAMKAEYDALSEEGKEIVTEARYQKLLKDMEQADKYLTHDYTLVVRDKSANHFDMNMSEEPNATIAGTGGTIGFKGYSDVKGEGANEVFNNVISGTKAFTIEATVNPMGDGSYNMIASKGDNSAAFRISDNTAYFFVKDDVTWRVATVPLTGAEMNSWVHVAAIYDGKSVSAYVEGKELKTTAAGAVAASSYPFGIGYCPETKRTSSNYIKNIRVYNTALTKETLDAGSASAEDENVVLWYDFDQFEYVQSGDTLLEAPTVSYTAPVTGQAPQKVGTTQTIADWTEDPVSFEKRFDDSETIVDIGETNGFSAQLKAAEADNTLFCGENKAIALAFKLYLNKMPTASRDIIGKGHEYDIQAKNGKLMVWMLNNYGYPTETYNLTEGDIGKWLDVIMVNDGIGKQYLYVDGKAANSDKNNATIAHKEDLFTIGSCVKEADGNRFKAEDGYLADIKFYNKLDMTDVTVDYSTVQSLLEAAKPAANITVGPYTAQTVWSELGGAALKEGSKFEANTSYTAVTTLKAQKGYIFNNSKSYLDQVLSQVQAGSADGMETSVKATASADKKTITISVTYLSKSCTCKVADIAQQDAEIELDINMTPKKITLNPVVTIGGACDMEWHPNKAVITYAVKDGQDIVSVNSRGEVTVSAVGEATITVTATLAKNAGDEPAVKTKDVKVTVTTTRAEQAQITALAEAIDSAEEAVAGDKADLYTEGSVEALRQVIASAKELQGKLPLVTKAEIASAVEALDLNVNRLQIRQIAAPSVSYTAPSVGSNPQASSEDGKAIADRTAQPAAFQKKNNSSVAAIEKLNGIWGFNDAIRSTSNVDKFDVYGSTPMLISFKMYIKKLPTGSNNIFVLGKMDQQYGLQLNADALHMYMKGTRNEGETADPWPDQYCTFDPQSFTGKWHDVIMATDGNSHMKLYLDGHSSFASSGRGTNATAVHQDQPFTIGYNPQKADTTMFTSEYGSFADIKFYSGNDVTESFTKSFKEIRTLLNAEQPAANITLTPYDAKTTWTTVDGTAVDGAFAENTAYKATTVFTAREGYVFGAEPEYLDQVKAQISAGKEGADVQVAVSEDRSVMTVTVSYEPIYVCRCEITDITADDVNVDLTANEPQKTVKLEPQAVVGGNCQVTGHPNSVTYTYSIKDGAGVVELDEENSAVIAKKAGEATITVTATLAKEGEETATLAKDVKVTVTEKCTCNITAITMADISAELTADEPQKTIALAPQAVVADCIIESHPNSVTYTYSIKDGAGVVELDEANSAVIAKKAGEATITVTATLAKEGEDKATLAKDVKVTVTEKCTCNITAITMADISAELTADEPQKTIALAPQAVVTDCIIESHPNNVTYTYRIKDGAGVVELDEANSAVIAKKAGEATITVTATLAKEGEDKATLAKDVKVTVTEKCTCKLTDISITDKSAELTADEPQKTIKLDPQAVIEGACIIAGHPSVTYAYSIQAGADIVELDEENSAVIAKKAGEATITVTATLAKEGEEPIVVSKNVKITVTTTIADDALIGALRNALAGAKEAIADEAAYTADSVAKVKGAIADAEELLKKDAVSVSEVNRVMEALDTAVDGLVRKSTTTFIEAPAISYAAPKQGEAPKAAESGVIKDQSAEPVELIQKEGSQSVVEMVDGVLGFAGQYATDSDSDKFDVYGSEAMAIAFKLYVKKLPPESQNTDKNDENLNILGKMDNQYGLQLSNTKLLMYMNSEKGWPEHYYNVDADSFLGTWHDIVMMTDGKGHMELYVDGAASIDDRNVEAIVKHSEQHFTIGYNWTDGKGKEFTSEYGYLSDIRFYRGESLTAGMEQAEDYDGLLALLAKEEVAAKIAPVYTPETVWTETESGTALSPDSVFEAGKSYKAVTTITAQDGYVFENTDAYKEEVQSKLSGVEDADVSVDISEDGKKMTVIVAYAKTQVIPCTCKLTDITQANITLDVRTAKTAVLNPKPVFNKECEIEGHPLASNVTYAYAVKTGKDVAEVADGKVTAKKAGEAVICITGTLAKGEGEEPATYEKEIKVTVTDEAANLQTAINNAKDKIAGDKEKLYTEPTVKELKAKIEYAQGVFDNTSSTQAQIADAIRAVQNAADGLRLQEDLDKETAKNALADLLENARKIVETQNKDGIYTKESFDRFCSLFTAAEAVYKKGDGASLAELRQALADLEGGLKMQTTQDVAKEALARAVAAADAIFAAGAKGYTESSWKAFADAYQAAKQASATADATALNALADALVKAQAGLVKADNSQQQQTPVEPAIKKGQTFKKNGITFKVLDAAKKTVAVSKVKSKKKSITVPATIKIKGVKCKVVQISDKAFKGLGQLRSVVIGKNVAKIGKEAFANCRKLSKITVKANSIKTIQKYAFKKTASKVTVTVPKGMKNAQGKKLLNMMKKKGLSKRSVVKK